MATEEFPFGPFECPEHGDAGEGRVLFGFGGPFPLSFLRLPGKDSDLLGEPTGLGDMAHFTEWGSDLAGAHPKSWH